MPFAGVPFSRLEPKHMPIHRNRDSRSHIRQPSTYLAGVAGNGTSIDAVWGGEASAMPRHYVESKRPGVNRKGQFRLFVGTEILFRVFQTREAILPDLIQQVLLRLVFSPFSTFHSGGVVQGNGAGRAGLQFCPGIGFHGRQAGPVFLRPDRTLRSPRWGYF